jgi:hypothetical protein
MDSHAIEGVATFMRLGQQLPVRVDKILTDDPVGAVFYQSSVYGTNDVFMIEVYAYLGKDYDHFGVKYEPVGKLAKAKPHEFPEGLYDIIFPIYFNNILVRIPVRFVCMCGCAVCMCVCACFPKFFQSDVNARVRK